MNILIIKRIVCISCLIMVLSYIGISYAATSDELKNQQKKIDDQIEETKSEIAGAKSKMTDALNQINQLNTEISSYENDISDLQSQIDSLNSQIAEKEVNIAQQEEKFNHQKELLDKRLVAMYENGTISYLDMLLSADGLADFISSYYMISQIAELDEELLTSIENTKNQIANEKNSLELARNEIKNSQEQIEGKKVALVNSRNTKKSLVSTLTAEEAALQEQLEEFENDKKAIQSELAALAKKNSVKAVAPSAAGYISPLPGKTKSNITTGMNGYSGHTGVDFACAAGTTIVAVKSGKVIKSTALINQKGQYKSYGEYIVIDHGDGTMTLYAHGSPNSRKVKVGDTVSQGQHIMDVGTTGNSTGNHLHFEVLIGGKPKNPVPYLP